MPKRKRDGWMSVETFKRLRNDLGFTQESLAKFIGCSRVSIEYIETGRLKHGVPNDMATILCLYKERQMLWDWIAENHSEGQCKRVIGRGVDVTLGRQPNQ